MILDLLSIIVIMSHNIIMTQVLYSIMYYISIIKVVAASVILSEKETVSFEVSSHCEPYLCLLKKNKVFKRGLCAAYYALCRICGALEDIYRRHVPMESKSMFVYVYNTLNSLYAKVFAGCQ